MSGTFRDHFAPGARDYAAFRPDYPDALFDAVAALAPDRRVAWDCATGTGQATEGLAARFAFVVATDASAAQISAARPRARVAFVRAAAEAAPLADASISLVTVAQALHWLDLPRFFAEVRRVLVPGGALAAWAYTLCTVTPDVDVLVNDFYERVVGPYWPPERALVDSGYRDVRFPFEPAALPPLAIVRDMTGDDLAGYLRTWSAVHRFRAATGRDPVADLQPALREAWGGVTHRTVRWPLVVHAGVVD